MYRFVPKCIKYLCLCRSVSSTTFNVAVTHKQFPSLSLLQDSEIMFQPESDQMSPVEPKVRDYTHKHLHVLNKYPELYNNDRSLLADACSLHPWT